jgi:hypothetical protein
MERYELTYHETQEDIFCQTCSCVHLDCECDDPNLWNISKREKFDWKTAPVSHWSLCPTNN